MTKTGTDAVAPVTDRAESFTDWVRGNSRIVSIAAAVVLGAVLIFYIARWNSANKEAQASRSLAEAERSFAAGNMPLAQTDLQRVVQRYGGTTAGRQATLLLAQAYFSQNKVAEGLKVLDEAGNPEPFVSSFHAVRAAGLEQSGKPAEAAAEYLRASSAALGDAEKAEYRAEAARAYLAAGNAAEAQRILSELAADDTNPMAQEAALRLGEAAAKAVAK